MTRRQLVLVTCALVVLAMILVLTGCTSTARAHHRGSGERVVQLRLTPGIEAHVALATLDAAQNWSDGVDRLRFDVAWGTCQPGEHCVDIVQEQTDGYASLGNDDAGHMYGRAGYVAFGYGMPWEWALFVACHELGHVVGLGHSPIPWPAPGSEGPCDYDTHDPTVPDLTLANAMYAHDD